MVVVCWIGLGCLIVGFIWGNILGRSDPVVRQRAYAKGWSDMLKVAQEELRKKNPKTCDPFVEPNLNVPRETPRQKRHAP